MAGESIWDVAVSHGLTLEQIWNHAENAKLKKHRKNPNVLLKGDCIYIPEITRHDENCGTESRHRFRRLGVPLRLHLRFLRFGQPRANVPWVAEFGPFKSDGTTDGDGAVNISIPPGQNEGLLQVGSEDDFISMHCIRLAHLDPVDDIRGQQQRLRNLGYGGQTNGRETNEFVAAISQFQGDNDLDMTGKADTATKQILKEVHGC